MEKIDLKVEDKSLYAPSAKTAAMVTVPGFQFFMLDGAGDPNTSPRFQAAIEALFTLSYTLKFLVRKAREVDYGVMPPEGLWWAEDMSAFMFEDKSAWLFTLMIRQPEFITPELVEEARAQAMAKKPLPALAEVRLERFAEGPAAQIMHIGPYAEEGPTVETLHRFIRAAGKSPVGKHHEIYLGDPRRTAPARLHTIIRQPVTE